MNNCCVCVVQLMELQSRFGKDERFKMDSRFLEQIEDKEAESGEGALWVELRAR